MSQKSSTFVQETRERETWLPAAVERSGAEAKEAGELMATAALVRGTLQAIQVPEEAEERSRAKAVAHMQALREERVLNQSAARAPWYLSLGRFMRFVFTLGRRR